MRLTFSSRLISNGSFTVSATQRTGSVFLISLRLARRRWARRRPSPMVTTKNPGAAPSASVSGFATSGCRMPLAAMLAARVGAGLRVRNLAGVAGRLLHLVEGDVENFALLNGL
jgi:hypothetical protein